MIRRLCPLLLMFVAAALPLTPASKEILDLQRDVAQLQEQIRLLTQAQSAQTQQLTALECSSSSRLRLPRAPIALSLCSKAEFSKA